MDFEKAHKEFLEYHIAHRTGERKGRLLRGHNHAEKLMLEKLWWPVLGNLDHLHPEYEVYDWNRKSQFIDIAYLPPSFLRIGTECDGFQSHVKDMDRESFSYALKRDTFLTGMGWKMLHFAYDDILKQPEVCRMLLQLVISPHQIRSSALPIKYSAEKEILRHAWKLGRPIRPCDVTQQFEVDFRTARKWLRHLAEQGCLTPVVKRSGVLRYELTLRSLDQLI